MREELQRLGYGRFWSARYISDDQWTDLKGALPRRFKLERDARIAGMSSMRTYNRVGKASERGILQRPLNHPGAAIGIKLRCFAAPIMETVGAWMRLELKDRTCLICNQNAVEDAEHFTSKCTFYDDLRKECQQRLLKIIGAESQLELRRAVEDLRVDIFLGDKLLANLPDELRMKFDSTICGFLKKAWRRREEVWKTLCVGDNPWQLR